MSNLSRNKVRPNPLPSISQLPGPIAVLRGPEANGGITGERRITHQYSVYLNIYKWDCWLKIESLSGMKWDCTKIFRTQWRIFNQQYQEAWGIRGMILSVIFWTNLHSSSSIPNKTIRWAAKNDRFEPMLTLTDHLSIQNRQIQGLLPGLSIEFLERSSFQRIGWINRIDLTENLEETMDFPIKLNMGFSCKNSPFKRKKKLVFLWKQVFTWDLPHISTGLMY